MSNAFSEFQRHADEARQLLRNLDQRIRASKRGDREQMEGSRNLINSSREMLQRSSESMARQSPKQPG